MIVRMWKALALAVVPVVLAAQVSERAAPMLPETAAASLDASLQAASHRPRHTWRDTPPYADRLVNAYIEIPRG